ncbi:MAG: DUF11 domain-containing protein, partial [Candidatus Promineifilaceae bacterium]|nr:DUF11 domain-containing protein [Candidatus Promineifilaceae bacterium]
MIAKLRSATRGQALVEFSLIIILLLFVLFIIIEGGRMFQAWLTVQNAARSAGRYAITGQFDENLPCLSDPIDRCFDPRVPSIKNVAFNSAAGLSIDPDAPIDQPRSFYTEVWSRPEDGNWTPDSAGGPGDAVRIRATYELPFVTPLIRVIVESISLVGQVVVTNEQFIQVGSATTFTAPADVGDGGGSGAPPVADVRVEKFVRPSQVIRGNNLEYEIVVTNEGPFDAVGIFISDTLPFDPDSIDYTYSWGAPATCTETSGLVSCQIPNLQGDAGPESTESIIMTMKSPTGGVGDEESIVNTVTVSSDQSVSLDDNMLNNTATVTATLRKPKADMGVSITDYTDSARPGESLTYDVVATNYYSSEFATDVEVTVRLASILNSTVTVNANGHDCDLPVQEANDTVISCRAVNPIVALDSMTFFVTLNPVPDGPRDLTATATVTTSSIQSPNDQPDQDTDLTAVADNVADLSIIKASFPERFLPGDTVEPGPYYLLTVTAKTRDPNDGAAWDPAQAITITDTLGPNALTVDLAGATLDANLSGGTLVGCTQDGLEIICVVEFDSSGFSQGESINLQIPIINDPDNPPDPGTYGNTAEVSSDLIDALLFDNIDSVETAVAAGDLEVSKSLLSAELLAGEPITYSITASNLAPSGSPTMTGVRVWDALPEGFTLLEADPSPNFGGYSCNGALPGDELDTGWCFSLEPGASETFVFSVIAQIDGTFTNTAYVESNNQDQPDLDLTNNVSEVATVVQPLVDVIVFKDAPASFVAGNDFKYTIDVDNLGPSSSGSIQLVDQLPEGVSFVGISGCNLIGDVIANRVDCSLSDLAGGTSATIEITVTTAPSLTDGSTITNTVMVTPTTQEFNTENNSASAVSQVDRVWDLALGKVDLQDPVPAGAVISYSLIVTNSGPSFATSFTISDTIPASTTFDTSSSHPDCSAVDRLVTCSITQQVPAGGTLAIPLGIRSDSSLPNGTVLLNQAELDSTQDGLQPNDFASEETTLSRLVDLTVAKTATPDPIVAGEPVTYTAFVTNNGPSDVLDQFVVIDTISKVYNANSLTLGDGCVLGQGNKTVECVRTGLAAGETISLTIFSAPTQSDWGPDVNLDGTGTIENIVSVEIPPENTIDPEGDTSNNQATILTDVVREFDVAISKSGPTDIVAGQSFDYVIEVVGLSGPSDDATFVVSDTLPIGVDYLGFTFTKPGPGGVSCSGTGVDPTSVECQIDQLDVGTIATINLEVRVDSALTETTLLNQAEVISITGNIDTDGSNNLSQIVSTDVSVSADLQVTKSSDDGGSIVAGDPITYTYTIEVANIDFSDALSVTLADTSWPA